MASPKWKIRNVSENYSFKRAAKIILKERIKKASDNIKLYLKEENPERLHDVRISVRRLRYNFELFYVLFDSKKFMKFYNMLVDIQDTTGKVRDIYITSNNILLFQVDGHEEIQKDLKLKMEEQLKVFNKELRTQLLAFLKSNELKNIIKMIK